MTSDKAIHCLSVSRWSVANRAVAVAFCVHNLFGASGGAWADAHRSSNAASTPLALPPLLCMISTGDAPWRIRGVPVQRLHQANTPE
jgi:hypothetical protein